MVLYRCYGRTASHHGVVANKEVFVVMQCHFGFGFVFITCFLVTVAVLHDCDRGCRVCPARERSVRASACASFVEAVQSNTKLRQYCHHLVVAYALHERQR